MIDAYLTDTVTIVRVTLDGFNHGARATVATPKAFIQNVRRVVRVPAGQDVLSSANVFVKANVDVRPTDLIQIDGIDHAILRIDKARDFAIDHLEIVIA